jgi:hypothetical protein
MELLGRYPLSLQNSPVETDIGDRQFRANAQNQTSDGRMREEPLGTQGAKYLSSGNKIGAITNIPDSACVLVQLMSDENTNTSLGRELN